MAQIKVIVGALLACAICAHAFPAGEDGTTVGPRPLPGAFLPSNPSNNRPVPLPGAEQGVRPAREAEPDSGESKESKESHEAAGAGATSKAPVRRDVTTSAPQEQGNGPTPAVPNRPLLNANPSSQVTHLPVKREESTLRPGAKPGPTESSHTVTKREDSTLRPGAKPGPTVASHTVTKREDSTLRPGAKPGPTVASHTVTKREDSTLRPGARPGATEASHTVTKREESTLRPGAKPGPTEAPSQKSRRDATTARPVVKPYEHPARLPPSQNQKPKPTRQVTSQPNPARPSVRPVLATGVTPAGTRTKRQAVSTAAPSVGNPTAARPQPPRPLPVNRPTQAQPQRPVPAGVSSGGSKTKRDDEVHRPLDLQGEQPTYTFQSQPFSGGPIQQSSEYQPEPAPSEVQGVHTSFAVSNPQQPGVQTFGGITHGTVNRPEGTASFASVSTSSTRSKRQGDDGDDDDIEQ